MNEVINWTRIIACGGVSFFTSMAANLATGNINSLETSILIAFITGGLALFTELKLESYGTTGALQNVVKQGLVL